MTKDANSSSKGLIRTLFSFGELARLPFIPIVYRFGAKLTQMMPEEMSGDATPLTHGLLTCQELFGYDGIVSGFDFVLHHQSAGRPAASEDGVLTPALSFLGEGFQIEKMDGYSVGIEATRRLNQMVGKRLGLFGIATGPITLAHYLGGRPVLEDPFGESSRESIALSTEVCLKTGKAYGELQLDGLLFFEWVLSSPLFQSVEPYRSPYQTLSNVCHFYNSRLTIALPHFDLRHLKALCQLSPDALLLGKWGGGDLSFSDLKELSDAYQLCFGIGIPFSSGKEEGIRTLDWVIQGMRMEGMKRGVFLSSAGEIPDEMDAGDMHEFMERIQQIRL